MPKYIVGRPGQVMQPLAPASRYHIYNPDDVLPPDVYRRSTVGSFASAPRSEFPIQIPRLDVVDGDLPTSKQDGNQMSPVTPSSNASTCTDTPMKRKMSVRGPRRVQSTGVMDGLSRRRTTMERLRLMSPRKDHRLVDHEDDGDEAQSRKDNVIGPKSADNQGPNFQNDKEEEEEEEEQQQQQQQQHSRRGRRFLSTFKRRRQNRSPVHAGIRGFGGWRRQRWLSPSPSPTPSVSSSSSTGSVESNRDE